jgi:hypothetical protein
MEQIMSNTEVADNKKSFSDFDRHFQQKIVQALLTDRQWAAQMAEVLDVEYFDYVYLRQLSTKYLEYYRKYKEFPSLELFVTVVREDLKNEADAVLATQVKSVIVDTKNKKDLGDLQHVKDVALSFCRQQGFRNALVECTQLIKDEDQYDRAVNLVKKAITAGQAHSPGMDLETDIDARYSETYRNTIRTNIQNENGTDGLDSRKILNGGAGSGELNVVVAPTGCHAKGTKILLASGHTQNVEDIKVGSILLGPDGSLRFVQKLVRGTDRMYKIVPIKGESFIVNGQHILSLKRTSQGSKTPNKNGEVVNLTVEEYLQTSNAFKHLHKLYRSDGVDFFQDESELLGKPIPSYVLGQLLGDGCLREECVEFTTSEPEMLSEMSQFVDSLGLRMVKHLKPENKACGYRIVGNRGTPNRKLKNALESLGLLNILSGEKFIPYAYKTGSKKTRLDMLAGLLDTDGHLIHQGFEYCSKSKQLADDVVFVARSLGLSASCSFRLLRGTKYYRVWISGDCSIIPTRLIRKQASGRQQVKNHLVTGFSVEQVADDEFYGFQVDGDHLYLMGDFTITHNCGKSHFLVHIGAQGLLQNKNVLHFTFELNERAVGIRYDSHLLDIDSLECPEHKEEIKAFYAGNAGKLGKLRVKYFPTGTATVNTLRAFIDKLALENFRPDMVVVDYAQIMRSTEKYELPRMELKKIFEELRCFAGELDVPVWTACQSNKEGADSDIISLANMSEAYSQAHICDFVIGLGRPETQKATGLGTIFIAKNRAGIDGVSFKVRINTARSRITMLSEEEVRNLTAEQEREKEEGMNIVRRTLRDINTKKVMGNDTTLFFSSGHKQ